MLRDNGLVTVTLDLTRSIPHTVSHSHPKVGGSQIITTVAETLNSRSTKVHAAGGRSLVAVGGRFGGKH